MRHKLVIIAVLLTGVLSFAGCSCSTAGVVPEGKSGRQPVPADVVPADSSTPREAGDSGNPEPAPSDPIQPGDDSSASESPSSGQDTADSSSGIVRGDDGAIELPEF